MQVLSSRFTLCNGWKAAAAATRTEVWSGSERQEDQPAEGPDFHLPLRNSLHWNFSTLEQVLAGTLTCLKGFLQELSQLKFCSFFSLKPHAYFQKASSYVFNLLFSENVHKSESTISSFLFWHKPLEYYYFMIINCWGNPLGKTIQTAHMMMLPPLCFTV